MEQLTRTLIGEEPDEALLAGALTIAQTEAKNFCGSDTLPQGCLPALSMYAAALYLRYRGGEGERRLKSISRGDYTATFSDREDEPLEQLHRALKPFRKLRF